MFSSGFGSGVFNSVSDPVFLVPVFDLGSGFDSWFLNSSFGSCVLFPISDHVFLVPVSD